MHLVLLDWSRCTTQSCTLALQEADNTPWVVHLDQSKSTRCKKAHTSSPFHCLCICTSTRSFFFHSISFTLCFARIIKKQVVNEIALPYGCAVKCNIGAEKMHHVTKKMQKSGMGCMCTLFFVTWCIFSAPMLHLTAQPLHRRIFVHRRCKEVGLLRIKESETVLCNIRAETMHHVTQRCTDTL